MRLIIAYMKTNLFIQVTDNMVISFNADLMEASGDRRIFKVLKNKLAGLLATGMKCTTRLEGSRAPESLISRIEEKGRACFLTCGFNHERNMP